MHDTRYHGKFMYFDEPNIIVFINQPPKMSYLSRDRWQLWTIENQQLVRFEFPEVGAHAISIGQIFE